MKPDDYIREARSWAGTPFRHKGRTKGVCVDCIGLVYGPAVILGLTAAVLPAYARSPHGGMLEQSLRDCPDLEPVHRGLQPADILVFKFTKDSQHVGIYTGRNLIHSYEPVGGYTEHRYCEKWEKRRQAAFRFKAFA